MDKDKFVPKKTYEFRREKGLCAKCGKIHTGKKTFCPDCSEERSKYKKQLREMRRKSGLCTICGKRLDNKKYKTCLDCRVKDSMRIRKPVIREPALRTKDILSLVKASANKENMDNGITKKLLKRLEIELELKGWGAK